MARGAAVGRATARQLQTLLRLGSAGNLSDCELVARFVARGDSEAFALLVERHGPMVLRICQDVLGDGHDAHDAFQATFLVLIRRAGSIRKRRSLGSWLHGVARRVAGKLRSASARRRLIEVRAGAWRAQELDAGGEAPGFAELLELHDGISRLPEKYRTPIVLCYLEGLSHTEAAERLAWPVGTVRGRLARARERLRDRLVRRGLAPVLVGARLPVPDVPEHLMHSIVHLARAACERACRGAAIPSGLAVLAEGAIRPMWINKSTMLAASVVLGGALVSGAAWLRRGELVVEAPLTQDERHRVVSPGSANARPTIDAALTGSVGHGFAFADFDDDGRLDVYVADPHRRLTRTQDCTVCHNVPEGFHPSRPQVRHRSASSLGNVTLRPWRDDYRVDQGDVLRFRLKLAGRDPEAAEHVVGPGGQISKLWSLGIDMNVRGMTSQEIKRQVVQELRRHLTDLELQLVKVDGGRLVAVKPEDCPVVDVAIAGFSSRVVVSVGGEGSVIDGVDGRAQASTGASIDQRLRGQEERLKALEAKLDRVLEAIEKQAARTR